MNQTQRQWLRPDVVYPLLLALILVSFYLGYLAPHNYKFTILTWDGLRDVICAQHLRAGGSVFADPATSGFWFWYPPTNAIFFSTLSWLFHIDLFKLYAISPVILNWLFAAGFYCFMRRLLNGDNAFAFWATLGLASLPWAVTYVIAFPTVMAHAAGFAMLILFFYLRWLNWRYGVYTSAALVGLMGLYHPPTAIILVLTIAFHRAWMRDVRGMFLFLIVSLAVCSPYWIVQLASPVLNPDPIRYISPAMMQSAVVLPGFTPLMSVVFFLLVGFGAYSFRTHWREPNIRLVFSLLLVGAIGQSPAYLLKLFELYAPELNQQIGEMVPVLVPHEFQLYSQVALLMIAGCGLKYIWNLPAFSKPAIRYVLAICLIAWIGAMMIPLAKRTQAFCEPYRMQGEWAGVVDFIHANADEIAVNDVICAPEDEISFFVTGLRTGRKSLATYASHMNPRADHRMRAQVRDVIINTGHIQDIEEQCGKYNIKYILAWRKKTSSTRIELFQKMFETVYNDGNVFLFRVDF